MAVEPGWGEGTPSDGKRRVEGADEADEPARKAPRTSAQPNGWFDNSFSVSKQAAPAKAGAVMQAARSARWISPAFSREQTPIPSPAQPSSRPTGASSSSATARPSTSTPRLLQPASQLARSLVLPSSTPTRPAAQRRAGPPAFSIPSKQAKPDERIHHALLNVKPPVPPSTGNAVRSPALAQFGVASSQQKALPRPKFGVKSDWSDESKVDELDRGLLPSPEKKSRSHNKGGLADRADMIIAKQATANKLWSISEEMSALVPDLEVHVTSVLSTLPGRILTQCRMLKGALRFDDGGAVEGVVLFGAGNKELKEGMSVGIWKPWGEVPTKPLEPLMSTVDNEAPPAIKTEETEEPVLHAVTSDENASGEIILEDDDVIMLDADGEPVNLDKVDIQEQQSDSTPSPYPRALLVTRYRVLG